MHEHNTHYPQQHTLPQPTVWHRLVSPPSVVPLLLLLLLRVPVQFQAAPATGHSV